MSIKFDNTHKKIDVRNLKNINRRKINVSIGSVLLSLTLLSGCGKNDKMSDNNEIVDVSQNVIYVQDVDDNIEESIDIDENRKKM